jgi:hypothetical protein
MFHEKYLTSSLYQFREDDFQSFFYYIHERKTYDPRGGANFDAGGKIGVPIDDIISKLKSLYATASQMMW